MLISVIIPFYNRFEFVNNAICSVLNQTYHNWELILIDDRSDEIYISNFHDDRIKLIRNDMNIGPGASRQKGIEYSNVIFVIMLWIIVLQRLAQVFKFCSQCFFL
jgi:glycosyltransferase involved in cell wall biosynthesis